MQVGQSVVFTEEWLRHVTVRINLR